MVKRLLFFVLSAVSSVCLRGQDVAGEALWPDDSDKEEARIFVYRPQGQDRPAPAVIVCPGGAYLGLAIDYEGHDAARWFARQGLVAVVLKYRMPRGEHGVPLEDAEQAVRVLKARAGQWQVDTTRIGVAGFSAGGHLAATLSTSARRDARPDFAVLFYPVIDMTDDEVTHAVSRTCLLGEEADDDRLRARYSLQYRVDSLTPPTLLMLSDDDTGVSPVNSLLYYDALKRSGIPAALYIFPEGEHGWGFLPGFAYHERMKGLLEDWLGGIGIRTKEREKE